MTYLSIILTIICLTLLSFLSILIFVWIKAGKFIMNLLKLSFQNGLNQNKTNGINQDMLNNLMSSILQNQFKK